VNTLQQKLEKAEGDGKDFESVGLLQVLKSMVPSRFKSPKNCLPFRSTRRLRRPVLITFAFNRSSTLHSFPGEERPPFFLGLAGRFFFSLAFVLATGLAFVLANGLAFAFWNMTRRSQQCKICSGNARVAFDTCHNACYRVFERGHTHTSVCP